MELQELIGLEEKFRELGFKHRLRPSSQKFVTRFLARDYISIAALADECYISRQNGYLLAKRVRNHGISKPVSNFSIIQAQEYPKAKFTPPVVEESKSNSTTKLDIKPGQKVKIEILKGSITIELQG